MQDAGANLKDELLAIIAEELGMDIDDFSDDTDISDLGNDTALSRLILKRIPNNLQNDIDLTTFRSCTDVADLKKYLDKSMKSRGSSRISSIQKPKLPITLLLQGNAATASKNIFLLPDGSGSGMAYMALPLIGPNVCVYGLNSPYLYSTEVFDGAIDDLIPLWTKEIQKIQPKGPYTLGGWSAGGYFSFEVTKLLLEMGHCVGKLILIDSPCRLLFEALPTKVVEYLSSNNLMGNWSSTSTPQWLVNSFVSTIGAVEKYMPTPMIIPEQTPAPEVFIIWASEGVYSNDLAAHPEIDMNVRVTRFLVDKRTEFGPLGWDKLFPGRDISIAKMPGSHFMIVHPPHVHALGTLLQDVVHDDAFQRQNDWQVYENRS
ncbi:Alpha/Beta hydrolase protein [Trichoderma ceciliae]